MGAKTFNELPLSARTSDNASDFLKIMNTIYTYDFNFLYC